MNRQAVVVVALLVALFVGILACAGLVFLGIALHDIGDQLESLADSVPGSEYFTDTWVDSEIEAGLHAPLLNPRDPLLERRILVLTTAINERSAREVVQKLLYLERLDPEAAIDFYIASPGGWLDSAFAIVDTMRSIRPPVNTHCLGGCYSAGNLILTAGTGRRTAAPNAILMVHANREEPGEGFDWATPELERFEGLYRSLADLPEDWFPMTTDDSYYLSAEEGVRFGLIDAIENPAWDLGSGDEPTAGETSGN